MNNNKENFLEPSIPFIVIKKVIMEIIEKAIQAHTENNTYWLKLHHFSESIKNKKLICSMS